MRLCAEDDDCCMYNEDPCSHQCQGCEYCTIKEEDLDDDLSDEEEDARSQFEQQRKTSKETI